VGLTREGLAEISILVKQAYLQLHSLRHQQI